MKTQPNKKGKLTTVITLLLLISICIGLGWHNYTIDSSSLVKQGVLGGIKMFIGLIPILIIFCFISGQISAYYSKKPEYVRSMVASSSVTKAALAGTLTPGGATAGPILESEWRGKGDKCSIVAFLIAMSLINWTTLTFRLPFLGEKLTLVVTGVGLFICILSIGILSLIQRFSS